jgi:hypothetical protein
MMQGGGHEMCLGQDLEEGIHDFLQDTIPKFPWND